MEVTGIQCEMSKVNPFSFINEVHPCHCSSCNNLRVVLFYKVDKCKSVHLKVGSAFQYYNRHFFQIQRTAPHNPLAMCALNTLVFVHSPYSVNGKHGGSD